MAIWDSDDTKLQEMIADVMRAATTRIGAPNATQATMMGDALKTAGGVYGNKISAGIHEAANALDKYKANDAIVQGQKLMPAGVTTPSLGAGGGIPGLTPDDTTGKNKKKLFEDRKSVV